jgi:hypothetical protein
LAYSPCPSAYRHEHTRRPNMLDAIFLIVGIGFFAAGIAYVIACDRM